MGSQARVDRAGEIRQILAAALLRVRIGIRRQERCPRKDSRMSKQKARSDFHRTGLRSSYGSLISRMRLARTRSAEKHRTNPDRENRDGESYLRVKQVVLPFLLERR